MDRICYSSGRSSPFPIILALVRFGRDHQSITPVLGCVNQGADVLRIELSSNGPCGIIVVLLVTLHTFLHLPTLFCAIHRYYDTV
jgi:hypothetical protein